MRRHAGMATALVLGLGGCRTAPTPAAARWAPPTRLSAATGSGAAPALAVSPTGVVTAAWTGAPGGGSDGRLFVRPDLRDTAEVELRDPLGSLTIYGETPPKLAYGPDGTLYAAYLLTRIVPGHRWPVNTLRLANSADGGRHWTAPVTVQADTDNGGSTDDHALLVGADGVLYLSWLAMTGDTSHTYVAFSRDRGRSWSRPGRVDEGPSCPCCRTALAVGPDGHLYAAWRRIFGHGGASEVRDIVVASSADGGAHWTPPAKVHDDEWHVNYCPDAGPTVKVGADGVVHVAWWTGAPGRAGVRYTNSSDGARTFAEPVPLGVAPASRASHAQLALDGAARVIVTWDDGTRAVPPIVVRVSDDGGRTFGPADTLSASGQSAGYPVVAVARDTAVVAWQERSPASASADSARLERALAAPTPDSLLNRVGAWSVLTRQAPLP